MKKTLAIIAIICIVLGTSTVFATSTKEAIESMPKTIEIFDSDEDNNSSSSASNSSDVENKNEDNKKANAVSNITNLKNKEKKTLEDYQKAYGSDAYGLTAYVLNRIQIYSIPFCFLGIAISAIYQYVLGIRKLDTRDKGFAIMISIITIFVIAQVLPLIFAIVVKGWRG